MRKFGFALLYTATVLLANVTLADTAQLESLRSGDMRKLTVHSVPMPTSDTPFLSPSGDDMTLADYQGQIVVLNFWATWCAPCRKEMPQLAALQMALGGDDLQVVTVAVGRNPRPLMDRFFAEIGVDNLPLNTDPKQAFARDMGVLGLPVTVLIDRDGNEIARLLGDADWSSDSAIAIMTALRDAP